MLFLDWSIWGKLPWLDSNSVMKSTCNTGQHRLLLNLEANKLKISENEVHIDVHKTSLCLAKVIKKKSA